MILQICILEKVNRGDQMNKIRYIFFLSCLVLVLSACGYREGIIQSDSKSYLVFTGNIQDTTVSIDNVDPFPLEDNADKVHYQVSHGKHLITIKRDNKLIINREIFLGKGMTKEINIK